MSDQGQRLTQMLDRIEVQFQVMQKLQDCFSTIEVPERKDILRETDRYHTDNFMADYVMDASGGIKEVRYAPMCKSYVYTCPILYSLVY